MFFTFYKSSSESELKFISVTVWAKRDLFALVAEVLSKTLKTIETRPFCYQSYIEFKAKLNAL